MANAQAPDWGTAYNYVLFTSAGALGNTGASNLGGNMGTNAGAMTGFESSTISGSTDLVNNASAQCATDLEIAYTQLHNTATNTATHAASFGAGETIFPGVYAISGAGSVGGNLYLDAKGNMDAVFILKFGGAFTTGAASSIFLSNGAQACNVFWVAEGAIAMGAGTAMVGTLIAHNGAISMGAGGHLQGRLFSTAGAASVYTLTATLPLLSPLAPKLLPSSGMNMSNMQHVIIKWNTDIETDLKYFSVERSPNAIDWQVVGMVLTSGSNLAKKRLYQLSDIQPHANVSFFRLKQTYLNGNYTYGKTKEVNCTGLKNAIH